MTKVWVNHYIDSYTLEKIHNMVWGLFDGIGKVHITDSLRQEFCIKRIIEIGKVDVEISINSELHMLVSIVDPTVDPTVGSTVDPTVDPTVGSTVYSNYLPFEFIPEYNKYTHNWHDILKIAYASLKEYFNSVIDKNLQEICKNEALK